MCLPFNHDWKDHWRVYRDTRMVGNMFMLIPSRYEILGRQCLRCGKWVAYAPEASAPRRGRAKRSPTPTYDQDWSVAGENALERIRKEWGLPTPTNRR